MAKSYSILILEDEPLILMDLEFAASDRGCDVDCAATCNEVIRLLEADATWDVAVLDVSLGGGHTCLPVVEALRQRKVPFILHSGDLDRQNETIRSLQAPLVAKPASADKVIGAAIAYAAGDDPADMRIAAE